MTLSRSPIKRRAPLAAKRKGGQRRALHPFPLPTGERITIADVHTELYAFGPQAELCRVTMCAACYFVQRRRIDRKAAVDWTRLPEVGPGASVAHHEPHRSTTGASLDRDTMPLCAAHHTEGNGDCVRHLLRSDALDSARFYGLLPFDWRAVVAEMRRRVALQHPKPIADATEETNDADQQG